MQERYEVGFRRTEEQHRVEEDVDLFLQLHWNRWGGDVSILTPERRGFLQGFAAEAFRRQWLSLRFLELDSRPVAAQLSFRFGGREFAFMSAADPEMRAEQLGIEMLFHSVRAAMEDGLHAFGLLPGDEEYKQRLPVVDRPLQQALVLVSTAGALLLSGRRLNRQAARAVRPAAVRRRRNAFSEEAAST